MISALRSACFPFHHLCKDESGCLIVSLDVDTLHIFVIAFTQDVGRRVCLSAQWAPHVVQDVSPSEVWHCHIECPAHSPDLAVADLEQLCSLPSTYQGHGPECIASLTVHGRRDSLPQVCIQSVIGLASLKARLSYLLNALIQVGDCHCPCLIRNTVGGIGYVLY